MGINKLAKERYIWYHLVMARPCYALKVEAGERREIEKRFRLAKNVVVFQME